MALPANYGTGVITGKFVDMSGTPIIGRVIATVDVTRMVDVSALTVIIPKPLIAVLDVDGYFNMTLPATDDPQINPTAFTYTITEDWAGGQKYSISVPEGSTTDLTAVVAVSASTGIVSIKGDKGDSGAVSGSYVYHQATASTAWVIDHNQGRYPANPAVVIGGALVKCRIEYVTANRIIARFNVASGPGDLYF